MSNVTVTVNPMKMRQVPREVTLLSGAMYRYVNGQIEVKNTTTGDWVNSYTYRTERRLDELIGSPFHVACLAQIVGLLADPTVTEEPIPATVTITLPSATAQELMTLLGWCAQESPLHEVYECLDNALEKT